MPDGERRVPHPAGGVDQLVKQTHLHGRPASVRSCDRNTKLRESAWGRDAGDGAQHTSRGWKHVHAMNGGDLELQRLTSQLSAPTGNPAYSSRRRTLKARAFSDVTMCFMLYFLSLLQRHDHKQTHFELS